MGKLYIDDKEKAFKHIDQAYEIYRLIVEGINLNEIKKIQINNRK
jgi:hypothetical protein